VAEDWGGYEVRGTFWIESLSAFLVLMYKIGSITYCVSVYIQYHQARPSLNVLENEFRSTDTYNVDQRPLTYLPHNGPRNLLPI
jgi:hypothetical protein